MEHNAGRCVDSGRMAGMGIRLIGFLYLLLMGKNGAVYAFFAQCGAFVLGGRYLFASKGGGVNIRRLLH